MRIEEFKSICSEQGLNLSEKQVKQFLSYAELLKEWNQKMNLTAITELEEVLDKHFYDSLLPSFTLEIKGKLCDVGAGAGFPSVPLKIAYPDLEVVICEPLNKRITFLEAVINELGLEKITCHHARAEDFAKEYRETFDVVTARAVANLPLLAELCIPLVKVGGVFLAMKGSNGLEENELASFAINELGCEFKEAHTRYLADQSTRINLTYKKIKKTKSMYPRHYSKMKKSPLIKEEKNGRGN